MEHHVRVGRHAGRSFVRCRRVRSESVTLSDSVTANDPAVVNDSAGAVHDSGILGDNRIGGHHGGVEVHDRGVVVVHERGGFVLHDCGGAVLHERGVVLHDHQVIGHDCGVGVRDVDDRLEAHRVMRVHGGRLHEVVRQRHGRRMQVHWRAELVAEPLGPGLFGRDRRVRQEPVDVDRPDGRVPVHGLLGHHRLGRCRPVAGGGARWSPGHVLHHVQHAFGRKRRPVGRQLREIGPSAERVAAAAAAAEPVHALGVLERRVAGRPPVSGIVRQPVAADGPLRRRVQPHPPR